MDKLVEHGKLIVYKDDVHTYFVSPETKSLFLKATRTRRVQLATEVINGRTITKHRWASGFGPKPKSRENPFFAKGDLVISHTGTGSVYRALGEVMENQNGFYDKAELLTSNGWTPEPKTDRRTWLPRGNFRKAKKGELMTEMFRCVLHRWGLSSGS